MIIYVEKHWKTILIFIVGILLLLPIIINALYLFNAWHSIFEKPSEWAIFWVTYMSSIASFAMVFMTWRTLKQSKEQNEANKKANDITNEENRKANRKENEINRKLQLKILNSQQEKQRLNDLRNKCIEHIQLFNPIGLKTKFASAIEKKAASDYDIVIDLEQYILSIRNKIYEIETFILLLSNNNTNLSHVVEYKDKQKDATNTYVTLLNDIAGITNCFVYTTKDELQSIKKMIKLMIILTI